MSEIQKYYASHEFHQNGEALIIFYSDISETAPMHTHDFYEIFYVFSGEAVHRVNGKDFKIRKHDLVFIRPNDVHCYIKSRNDDFKMANISFRSEVIDDIRSFFKPSNIIDKFCAAPFPFSTNLSEQQGEAFKKMLLQFCYKINTPRPMLRIAIRKFIMETFYQYMLCPDYNCIDEGYKIPDWFNDFYIYLQSSENYVKSTQEIIRKFGTNPEYTARLFKKLTNQNLSAHIAEKRIEYAYTQLLYTDLSIIDIAMNCGFENLSTFYHVFKRHFNATPNEMRALGKNPPQFKEIYKK